MRDDAKKPLVIGEVLSPGLIEIYDLVDSSGSMNDSVGGITKYQAAVNGVRTKMTELLKDPNATYLFSGVEFGSYWEEHHRTWGNRSEGKKGLVFETRYWRTAADSSLANKFSYLASGTALNDSIVKLLRDIKAAAPKGKVIVNLITDGGEYHSKVLIKMFMMKSKLVKHLVGQLHLLVQSKMY
jgi:hypothetical protein